MNINTSYNETTSYTNYACSMLLCRGHTIICIEQTSHVKTIYIVWLVKLTYPHQEKLTQDSLNKIFCTEIDVPITGNMVICICSFHDWFPDMHIFMWIERHNRETIEEKHFKKIVQMIDKRGFKEKG